jgi:hypothetical protein
MTVNGATVGLFAVAVFFVLVVVGSVGAYRHEWARIKAAHRPDIPMPPVDLDVDQLVKQLAALEERDVELRAVLAERNEVLSARVGRQLAERSAIVRGG